MSAQEWCRWHTMHSLYHICWNQAIFGRFLRTRAQTYCEGHTTNTGSRSPTTIPGPNRRDSVISGSDAALAVALRCRPTFHRVLDASVVAARHNHLLLRNLDVSTRFWPEFERDLTAQAAHSVVHVHLIDGDACR